MLWSQWPVLHTCLSPGSQELQTLACSFSPPPPRFLAELKSWDECTIEKPLAGCPARSGLLQVGRVFPAYTKVGWRGPEVPLAGTTEVVGWKVVCLRMHLHTCIQTDVYTYAHMHRQICTCACSHMSIIHIYSLMCLLYMYVGTDRHMPTTYPYTDIHTC